MREVTPEKIQALEFKIKNLEEEWKRMNRPHVSSSLKCSIITKLSELKGQLLQMKKTEAKQLKLKKKQEKLIKKDSNSKKTSQKKD
jgi:hypothetical protein